MRRAIGPGLLAAVVLCSFTLSVEARRMSDGSTISDDYLDPRHPATAQGVPVSVPLLRAYPGEPHNFHCVLLKSDGSPGRVSLQSLYAVAHGAFSPEIFRGSVSRQDLALLTGRDIANSAQFLIRFALSASGGDQTKALNFIKDAERRDAQCASRNAKFWRAQLDLAGIDKALLVDADGQWVVGMSRPGSGLRRYPGIVHILSDTYEIAGRITKGYEVAYARLAKLAAATPPRTITPPVLTKPEMPEPRQRPQPAERKETGTSPPAPKLPSIPERKTEPEPGKTVQAAPASPPSASPAYRPQEMEAASSELAEVLATARKYCLLHAAVSACKGSG